MMKIKEKQIPFFKTEEYVGFNVSLSFNNYDKESKKLEKDTINRLKEYKTEYYIKDIENLGLEETWNNICQFVIDYKDNVPPFLSINNFAELYEIGLATQDKILKKKSGQYYTPDDVAMVMAKWLEKCEGRAVCDVACGTGKLILTYLDLIGERKAKELIETGNLYLYDYDKVALKICWTTLAIKYGLDIADSIHSIHCDFLDQSVRLPDNCKVISNPPYARLNEIMEYWNQSEVLLDTREFYSAFMDKIFNQAKSTVIITPFSFISGSKFHSLRSEMCELGNGFIVAFDNVPGNIFCGRKHGIFNTNTANSVRAAITVFHNSSDKKGFRVTPLIRFKNEERKELLQCSLLESLLPKDYQLVNKNNTSFKKVDRTLSDVFEKWTQESEFKLKDFISKEDNEFLLDIPNTCRYFTTASSKKLSRTGSITIHLSNREAFDFIYCFINSSFAYWWWRIYDGGITYPVSLLYNIPLPYNLLSKEDKKYFSKIANEMISNEKLNIITKVNAGIMQENIKFPESYRTEINKRLLNILGYKNRENDFDKVHANRFFVDTL